MADPTNPCAGASRWKDDPSPVGIPSGNSNNPGVIFQADKKQAQDQWDASIIPVFMTTG